MAEELRDRVLSFGQISIPALENCPISVISCFPDGWSWLTRPRKAMAPMPCTQGGAGQGSVSAELEPFHPLPAEIGSQQQARRPNNRVGVGE